MSTGHLHLMVRISRWSKKEHHKTWCSFFGGPEEIRTPDPYNANVMRSQLRYRPMGYSAIILPEKPDVKKKRGSFRSRAEI